MAEKSYEELLEADQSLLDLMKKYPEVQTGVPEYLEDELRNLRLTQKHEDKLPPDHPDFEWSEYVDFLHKKPREIKSMEDLEKRFTDVAEKKRKGFNIDKLKRFDISGRGGTAEAKAKMAKMDTRPSKGRFKSGIEEEGGPKGKYTHSKKEKDLSMWQKIGKHFSENADDRDKLFQYLGSMGRELVKPIEPGKEAAGALIPTLSRGAKIAEDEYAARQSAAAETALKYAEARQKMSPMQYMTSNMKDAAEYVRGLGIDPNTAAGRREISKYLVTVGITPSIVSMQEALVSAEEDLQTYMMSGQTDEDVIKQKQIIITNYRNKIGNLLQGSLGGSAVTSSMTDDDLYVAGAQPNSLKATTLETINKGEFIPG